mgnify:CR=1 FL=1
MLIFLRASYALVGQNTLNGYCNIERIMQFFLKNGAKVEICGSCAESVQKTKQPEGDYIAETIFDRIDSNKSVFDEFQLFASFVFTTNLKGESVVNQKIGNFACISLGYMVLNTRKQEIMHIKSAVYRLIFYLCVCPANCRSRSNPSR